MKIDGYTDIEQIAHGGFAIVYRAVKVDTNQPVAIKVLNKLGDAEEQRFDRELVSLVALSEHPNVVTVLESGRTNSGTPYLALDFMAGGSLRDAVSMGALEAEDAVWVAHRLLGALAAAHAAGIVHRDIKPSNVLLGRSEVYLADFGIARFSEGTETTASALTTTVQYAAPETLAGGSSTVRSDLYSLGATLYTLLTGRAIHSDWKDALAAANQATPVRLDDVPDVLRRWMSTLLARDPAERPASADDALAALSALPIEGAPSERLRQHLDAEDAKTIEQPREPAPPPKPIGRKPVRRRWAKRTVAAVVAAFLVLAAGGTALALTTPRADDSGTPDTEERASEDTTTDGEDEEEAHDGEGGDGTVDTDADDDGVRNADDNCPNRDGDGAPNGCPDTDGDNVSYSDDECPAEAGTPATAGCPDTDGDGMADRDDDCPSRHSDGAPNGCPDTDDDDVSYSDDECPSRRGDGAPNGCPDDDGDGISHTQDVCPSRHGDGAPSGCPDTDDDNVSYSDDECPNQAGTPATAGCPDADGDGIIDGEDSCPNQAGPSRTAGCADSDGDGVPDKDDRCPTQAGPSATAGCPDTDGDRVADRDEAHPLCVNRSGPASNGGCRVRENCSATRGIDRARVDFDRNDGRRGDIYVTNGCQHYVELAGTNFHLVVNGSQYLLSDQILLGYFNGDGYLDVFQRRSDGTWRVVYSFVTGWVEGIQNSERSFNDLRACDVNRDGLDDIYVPSRSEYSQSTGTERRWSKWKDGRC